MTENGTGETTKIIRTGNRGKRKCAIGGEDAPVFELDIIGTLNSWREINQKFVNEKGEIPEERRGAQYSAAFVFVRDTAAHLCFPGDKQKIEEYQNKLNAEMSIADALYFLKLLQDEADALLPFFVTKSNAAPSSPEPTEVTFFK